MSKKGLLKIQFHSFECPRLKGPSCTVKARSADVQIVANVPYKEQNKEDNHYLPISEKILIEMQGTSQEVGYFELPMKKLYQIPLKRHLITINCITKDTIDKTIKPDAFGSLKISIVFLENWVGKFDVFVGKIQLVEGESVAAERQLYIECLVGDVSSQTTLKKSSDTIWFGFNELLPFTLQSIPGKIELTVKDKDMVKDQQMGKLVLEPQREKMFEQNSKDKEYRFEITSGKRKIVYYFKTSFKLKEAI